MRAQFVSNEKVKPEVKCCYLKAGFLLFIHSITSGFFFSFSYLPSIATLVTVELQGHFEFIRASCECIFISFISPFSSFSR